ncbi:MAG: hypothetical protein WCB11_04265 [Terriglobales bacterium]|jgi:hypothetical protein
MRCQLGVLVFAGNDLESVMSLALDENNKVARLFLVVNPEKLAVNWARDEGTSASGLKFFGRLDHNARKCGHEEQVAGTTSATIGVRMKSCAHPPQSGISIFAPSSRFSRMGSDFLLAG